LTSFVLYNLSANNLHYRLHRNWLQFDLLFVLHALNKYGFCSAFIVIVIAHLLFYLVIVVPSQHIIVIISIAIFYYYYY
jgi:hypothetical protein